jgi:opacity protein-like surface antigen
VSERTVGTCTRILSVSVVVFSLTAPAFAQDNRPRPHPGSTADFMFGRPKAAVGVRGSWVLARAGSDLYDFVTEQLTIEDSDFNGPAFGAEVGIAVSSRIEVIGGVEVTRSKTSSEYRAFVDNSNLPIEQETEVQNVHLSGAVRIALTPPGQSISRFAWIPRSVTPYVGAGAGVVHYEFMQRGDFVDFVDLSVFSDVFQSKGWAPSAHVFGGADIQVYRRLFLQLEGRYLWSSGELGSDFIDFDPIDLAGFRSTAGVRILF